MRVVLAKSKHSDEEQRQMTRKMTGLKRDGVRLI